MMIVSWGCSQQWGNDPPTAETHHHLLQSLRASSEGYQSTHQVTSEKNPRGRWTDVETAVYWAMSEEGVEMGIGRIDRYGPIPRWRLVQEPKEITRYVFHLKTIEGWPGTLIITPVDGEQVYETHATIGRFPDMPARQERAQKLIEAVEKWMQKLGGYQRLNLSQDDPG